MAQSPTVIRIRARPHIRGSASRWITSKSVRSSPIISTTEACVYDGAQIYFVAHEPITDSAK
jgi:hypothetical protein